MLGGNERKMGEGKKMSGWKQKRRSFFKSREVKLEEVEEEERRKSWFARLEQKDLEQQRKER